MKTVLFKIRGVDNCLGWGNLVYMPGRILMVDDYLVRSGGTFEGGISLTVTMEVGPMPITLSWHVTMSTDRFPYASWIIWLTTMVDPSIGVGACSSIGLSGVWSGWPVCKMPVMSGNPSGGTHSPTMASSIGVSTQGLEVARRLESQVIIGEPGAEPPVLPLCWTCSVCRWALLWLQWLQLQQQCHISPRLGGQVPHGLLPWKGGSGSKLGSPEPYHSLFLLLLQLFPLPQLWLPPQLPQLPLEVLVV